MKSWFKNPTIVAEMTELWDERISSEIIAKTLSKKFRIAISSSAVRGKAGHLQLTARSERNRNKPRVVKESPPEKPIYRTPSLPPIPKSKFFDIPVAKTLEWMEA